MAANRATAAAAMVALLAALIGAPVRASHGARTTADEPQYLLTATSLAEDGDLDISNQIAGRAYEPYHEITIDPQTIPLDDSGREVSPHDPLFPLLLALPVAVGGWVGARVSLAVMAALAAALTCRLAISRWAVAPGAAALVTAAGFVGIPLAPYGGQIYPEMAAAVAVLVAVGAIIPRPGEATGPSVAASWGPVAATVAAVVALPWLSVKYVPVAGVLGVIGVGSLLARGRRRSALLVVGVGLVAAVVYGWAHQVIYGGWTAFAAGDHFVDDGEFSVVGPSIDVIGRSRRLVGLLVDRSFGVASWAPVWLLIVPALATRSVRRSLSWWVPALVVGTGWLVATFVALTMHGWWVPGRQLVVVLPLALVLIAVWADQEQAQGRLWWVAVAGLVGAFNWVWLAIETSTGPLTLVVDLTRSRAPIHHALGPLLPDGIRAAPVDEVLLVGWAVLLIVVAVRAGASTERAPSTNLLENLADQPGDR